MDIKKSIEQNIVAPSEARTMNLQTYGRVTLSNEKTNVCTVVYEDRNGIRRERNNVRVDIDSANQWFPSAGDTVLIRFNDTTPYIAGRYYTDYNADIRQKEKTLFDIFSDAGLPMGNQIS